MPKTPEPVRRVPNLPSSRLHFERSARTPWLARPPAGTLPEDLLDPAYWKHLAQERGIKVLDIINVVCEDNRWAAQYLVRDVGPYHAKLVIMKPDSAGVCWFEEITGLPQETKTHIVAWTTPTTKWGVKRKSDNETVEAKFETPQLAAAWMHEHIKEIAA